MVSFRYIFLFVFCCSVNIKTLCQCRNTTDLYKSAVAIIKNTSNNVQNLQSLYKLKEEAERCNLMFDSVYVYLLIHISYFEYKKTHDPNSSIKYLLEAIEIDRSLQSQISQEKLLYSYCNIGIYYDQLFQYNNALAYYDSVLNLTQQQKANSYRHLARYYKTRTSFIIGDFQKTIDESNLALQETSQDEDPVDYIKFLNWRAQSFFSLNFSQPALKDLNSVVVIAKKANENFELANAYKTKALLFAKYKTNDSAEYYFTQTIKVRPFLKNETQTIAEDYNDLGDFYLNSLNDFTKAKTCFLKAIHFGNEAPGRERISALLVAYENMGYAFYKQNNMQDAIRFYTQASNVAGLSTKNFLFINSTLHQIEVLRNKYEIFFLLYQKTAILSQLFASTNQPKYSTACFETAMITDSFLTKLRYEQFNEKSKLFWRNTARGFYSTMIKLCYLTGNVKKAYDFMEKSRAVLLNDKWNELSADVRLPVNERENIERFKIKLTEKEQQLYVLENTSAKYAAIENALLQTKDSLEHFIKSLEKKYPLYYQYKYTDDVPPFQSVQQYLAKNNQSFVYYFTNDSAMYALAITKSKTNFIKVEAGDFDNKQLSQFIRLCSDKEQLNKHYDLYCSLSQTIYKKLFEPLQIPKGDVAICTDNFFIPFEALCRDDKGKDLLLNDYNFSYVYSVRSLMKSFTTKPASGNFIGFAPASFSSSLAVPDLPQSSTALQSSARFYSNKTLFTQQQATRSNFFTNASKYSVVTIFSHAKADTTDAEPELFMQDSVIHLSELQRLINPSIQFVLLSACQTNIGKNATGEGIYSLARGFASAGIPSVSATLWKADEAAIYQISTKFHEYLAKGMNKSEALQKAKLWYLQNADHEHTMPYYWANMVLIGNSQPVVLSSSNHWWLCVSAIVVGVVLVVFLLYCFYYKNNNAIIANKK